MPSTKARFSCGHRGFGGHCHRCADAEKMATKAKDSKDGEEKSRLTAEAARLKAPAVRKNKTTITTMAPTEPEAS